MLKDHGPPRPERTSGLSGMFDLSQLLSEQASTRAPSDGSNDTFGHSAAFSLGNLPPLASLKFQLASSILFLSPALMFSIQICLKENN